MPFKKLIEPLRDILDHLGFSEPLALQKQIILALFKNLNLLLKIRLER